MGSLPGNRKASPHPPPPRSLGEGWGNLQLWKCCSATHPPGRALLRGAAGARHVLESFFFFSSTSLPQTLRFPQMCFTLPRLLCGLLLVAGNPAVALLCVLRSRLLARALSRYFPGRGGVRAGFLFASRSAHNSDPSRAPGAAGGALLLRPVRALSSDCCCWQPPALKKQKTKVPPPFRRQPACQGFCSGQRRQQQLLWVLSCFFAFVNPPRFPPPS